jgi:hypothetical protein
MRCLAPGETPDHSIPLRLYCARRICAPTTETNEFEKATQSAWQMCPLRRTLYTQRKQILAAKHETEPHSAPNSSHRSDREHSVRAHKVRVRQYALASPRHRR